MNVPYFCDIQITPVDSRNQYKCDIDELKKFDAIFLYNQNI